MAGTNAAFLVVLCFDRGYIFIHSQLALIVVRLRTLEPYEMAEFVSPWQGFGGVCDFGTETSSLTLSITGLGVTQLYRVSYEKRPHMLTPISRSTRVAVGYGPQNFSSLLEICYAIPCVSRARRTFGYFAI